MCIAAALAANWAIPTWATSFATRPNPDISSFVDGVRTEANRRDLRITSADLRITVRGAIAQSSLTLSVAAKKGEEPAEAWLHFDLPKGAIVTGYGLDIDGKLVDGSLVDAAKARTSYEREVRGQVDPGLGEVDRTGGFNVRIFPVDDRAGRKVRVDFVAPVGSDFALPWRIADPDARWSIAVDALDAPVTAMLGTRTVGANGQRFIAGRGAVDDLITLRTAETRTIANVHPTTRELTWQAAGSLDSTPLPTGGSVRILWDRSRSQRDADVTAVTAQLREALRSLAPKQIEFVSFDALARTTTPIRHESALERTIAALRYQGASGTDALSDLGQVDHCILVSDGRWTLPSSTPPALRCRLMIIAAGEQADRGALSALAEGHGGRLVDPGADPGVWSERGIDRVVDAAGKDVAFASLPSEAGRFRLVAVNPSGSPLRIVSGGVTTAIDAPTAPAVPFAGDMAIVASRRLAEVEQRDGRAAFVDMSRRYSIASPTLSFIVLETAEDYIEHDIAPPANFPDMARYHEIHAVDEKDRLVIKSARFETLLADWQQEVDWWRIAFDPNARRPMPTKPAPPAMSAPPLPPSPPPPPAPSVASPVLPIGQEPPVAFEREGPSDVVVPGTLAPSPPPPPPPPMAERDGGDEDSEDSGDIIVAPATWNADRDYLKALDARPSDAVATIAKWEKEVGTVPSFYFDTSDWMARHKRPTEAKALLLSALDLPLADSGTIGLVAARLERWGDHDAAVSLRRRQLVLDDRPQIRRLLALALAARAKSGAASARSDYKEAIRLLVGIALDPLDQRFDGLDVIALREANALIPRLRALGGTIEVDERLITNLDSDVRVVMDWSADAVDLDLWVDEPNGERAIYNHPRTTIGGRLSNDMTAGYGPEDYWVRRAPDGTFTVRTNNFASDRIDPNGQPRLTVRLIRNFGRPNETEQSVDLELPREKEGRGNDSDHIIGRLVVPPKRQ